MSLSRGWPHHLTSASESFAMTIRYRSGDPIPPLATTEEGGGVVVRAVLLLLSLDAALDAAPRLLDGAKACVNSVVRFLSERRMFGDRKRAQWSRERVIACTEWL